MVDVGNNEAQPLNPGETITIPAGSKFRGFPVYNAAPPQPDPTPTEEVNAAQTGDSLMSAVSALGILFVASAIVLICSRKRRTLL